MKPVVGLTCSRDMQRNLQYKESYYCEGIVKAGATPLLIPMISSFEEDLPDLLSRLDGIILTGGEDIHPLHYGEVPKQGLGRVSPERDDMELAIINECIKNKIPMFGICRGLQVLNVSLGGDLYQDIYKQIKSKELLLHNQNNDGIYGNHSIDIESDSFLYNIFQQKIGWVNSYHHQAIRNLAPTLQAVAWSKDGLIEAVVHKETPTIFAVQWHPEKMWQRDGFSLKLFEHFIELLQK